MTVILKGQSTLKQPVGIGTVTSTEPKAGMALVITLTGTTSEPGRKNSTLVSVAPAAKLLA